MGPAGLERRHRRAVLRLAIGLGLAVLAAYGSALLWSQIWLAQALGAPIQAQIDARLLTLLTINGWLLAWRVLMRACFTASAYGWRQGFLSIPRLFVGNVIAILAAARAVSLHLGGGAIRWDKTHHHYPAKLPL
jgi:adsorption protein B